MLKNNKISRWQLIKTLRKHIRLSEKRSAAFNQNKIAKAIVYVMSGFMVLYLMFFAVMLALVANSSHRLTACEVFFGVLPFILSVDFLIRFMAQQTPSQLVKPYVLLPIGKYACVDCFIFNSVTSTSNLLWMAMFIPFAIMSVVFSEGIWVTLGFLLSLHLIIVTNSQWYVIVRTLVNKSLLWWLLPAAVYALIFSPWYIGKDAGISQLCDFYAQLGHLLPHWSVLAWIGLLLLMAIVILANRRLQFASVYAELSKTETTQMKHVTQLSALDRFGQLGEYVKLEIKSIMRNKNIRKGFIMATSLVVVFSLLISFTDIYQGGMTYFLVVYNFAIYGAMVLTRVMCYEGNYIDCLMVHKENIISLLKAKYIFYSLMLMLPFILMIPILVMGKVSLFALIAIMLITAGPVHCAFLYMAIWNKQTMPLNTKFIGKGSVENNWVQVVVQMAAFFLPMLFVMFLPTLVGEKLGYALVALLGLAFILTSNYWIPDIYKRMMKRKYVNMEGFRSSR